MAKNTNLTRAETVDKEFRKFDAIFGKIEKMWIKDPAVRQNVNVEPLYETYATFRDLRVYFENLERNLNEEDQESADDEAAVPHVAGRRA